MLARNQPSDNKFTLGTAQLGMDYGVTNTRGKPSHNEAISIIQKAVASGVVNIDTARSYGDAESRIGEALMNNRWKEKVNIITKLKLPENINLYEKEKIGVAVEESIFSSCQNLRLKQLPILLLHNWKQRFDYQETAWKRLLELKKDGYIKSLGVSVYTPEETIQAIEYLEIEHIQLPFNLLDWRWKTAGIPEYLTRRKEVIIYARSIFLQGLLIGDLSAWIKLKDFDGRIWINKLNKLVEDLGRESRADLCCAYVRSQPWIKSVVVGLERLSQLEENIKLFQNPLLNEQEYQRIEVELNDVPEQLLNPSKWKIYH